MLMLHLHSAQKSPANVPQEQLTNSGLSASGLTPG